MLLIDLPEHNITFIVRQDAGYKFTKRSMVCWATFVVPVLHFGRAVMM